MDFSFRLLRLPLCMRHATLEMRSPLKIGHSLFKDVEYIAMY